MRHPTSQPDGCRHAADFPIVRQSFLWHSNHTSMSEKKKKTASKPVPKSVSKSGSLSASPLPAGVTAIDGGNAGLTAPWMVAGAPTKTPRKKTGSTVAPADEMLLVCLQDPFEGIGGSWAKIVDSAVPASEQDPRHLWKLEVVLEIYRSRFFESWATRGSFTLDLLVNAKVCESAGTWGGNTGTTSGSGNCRVMIMRDAANKVRFSLLSGCRQATEKPMPRPDSQRFLNADIGFAANGPGGLTAGATAVISTRNWSRLIAGSSAATEGLAFDGKWRSHLEQGDGDAVAQGSWAFAVMSRADYSSLCRNQGWAEHVDG